MKKMKRFYSLKAIEKRKRREALNKMAVSTTDCLLEMFRELKRRERRWQDETRVSKFEKRSA